MPDVFTRRERSRVMAAVRGRGNKATELKLVAILRQHGITGWRRHPSLPARPDFVFPAARVAVFVDGCFWHGCRWHCRMPASNQAYWERKIGRNRERDRTATAKLRARGWRVLRIWEHALRDPDRVGERVRLELESRVQGTCRPG